MIKKAVILCGGLATRFLPFCKSIPKEMLPIIDKPLIQYIVEDLAKAGIEDVMVIVGRNKECLINHFDRNVELEDRLIATSKLEELDKIRELENLVHFSFTRQIIPRGTGHAVSMAKSWVNNEPFIMFFGDELFVSKNKSVAQQMLDSYKLHNKNIIATIEVEKKDVSKYGIISPKEVEKDFYKVEQIVEKPNIDRAPSNLAYCGPAVFKPEIFDYIEKSPEYGLEILLTDALSLMAEDNLLYSQNIDSTRIDVGNKEGFLKANIFMALSDQSLRPNILDYIEKITSNEK